MQVISDNQIRDLSAASVATIGNFDGLHLGHRALIDRCAQLAGDSRQVVVVTFDPSPQAWFSQASAPARLSSQRQKLELFEDAGVDLVWSMSFNQQLAQMTAAGFAELVLARSLSCEWVVVGEDFRFGKRREGDLASLRQFGLEHGFRVEALADVVVDGTKVSSTKIRDALALGRFDRAKALLGRPFAMQGEVIQGSHLGRKLGYPTANMRPEAVPSPLGGVFAVKTRIAGENGWRDAVASLGVRPAVGGKEFLVEVHIFDYSADLYGQRLEVRFEAKIRDEQNFACMGDLVAQMKKDESRAREILNTGTSK